MLCNKNSGVFFGLALFIDPAVNTANENAHLRKIVSHIRSHTYKKIEGTTLDRAKETSNHHLFSNHVTSLVGGVGDMLREQ